MKALLFPGAALLLAAGRMTTAPAPLSAQQGTVASRASAHSPLSLATLQDAAVNADPRQRELALQAAQTTLHMKNFAAEQLPQLSGTGQAQYQSQVTTIPIKLPGISIPVPSHSSYDAHLAAQQSIYDPTLNPRRAVERAQLAENQATVRTTLFGLREQVNESFFSAASLQQRGDQISAAMTDLSARLVEAADLVAEGFALPSDTSAIEATLLQRRQDSAETAADRHAALATLSALVGRTITERDTLPVPDLAADVAQARSTMSQVRSRPEYAQLSATRSLLGSQADAADAEQKPRVSAFVHTGYGRPGLNALSTSGSGYWVAGVDVSWAPWTWGTVDRTRESLTLQQQIVSADEAAFTSEIDRGVQADMATMDRLESALASDDRIIALREQIERETRIRMQEGVATSADYVDKSTDLLTARLARDQHRVDLAQTRAHFLTTLGLEVR